MPDGSYEIVLRIEDASGARREERRFFSKNPVLPAIGQKVLYAYGGVLIDDLRPGFLHVTGKPFVQAGGAMRLYAWASWAQDLPYDSAVEYRVTAGNGTRTVRF